VTPDEADAVVLQAGARRRDRATSLKRVRATRDDGAGDTVFGYYRNLDGDWTLLDSAPITTDPVNAAFSVYTNRSSEGAPEVSVAFDNFRVTRGVIDCSS
jgi:hypothetical protein